MLKWLQNFEVLNIFFERRFFLNHKNLKTYNDKDVDKILRNHESSISNSHNYLL